MVVEASGGDLDLCALAEESRRLLFVFLFGDYGGNRSGLLFVLLDESGRVSSDTIGDVANFDGNLLLGSPALLGILLGVLFNDLGGDFVSLLVVNDLGDVGKLLVGFGGHLLGRLIRVLLLRGLILLAPGLFLLTNDLLASLDGEVPHVGLIALLLHVFSPVASLVENRGSVLLIEDLLTSLPPDLFSLGVDSLVELAVSLLLAAGHGIVGDAHGIPGSLLFDMLLLELVVSFHLLNLVRDGGIHLISLLGKGSNLLVHQTLDLILHLLFLLGLLLSLFFCLLGSLEISLELNGFVVLFMELILEALLGLLRFGEAGLHVVRFELEVCDVGLGLVEAGIGFLESVLLGLDEFHLLVDVGLGPFQIFLDISELVGLILSFLGQGFLLVQRSFEILYL